MGPLSNEEVSRAFGAALPVAAYTTGAYAELETATVSAAFDNLFQGLADWRLTLLGRQLDAPKAPPIYEFPREFKKLRSILVPLLVEICRPGPSRPLPFFAASTLRASGPWWSVCRVLLLAQEDVSAAALAALSATRIFDVKKAAAAQQAGAQEATETRRIPQWVFLPQLFKEVLFKDATALTTSTFSTRTGSAQKISPGGGHGNSPGR